MRTALIGAAASAMLGGTLAITPLTTVNTPLPVAATAAGTCAGGKCERVASVLMPDSPKPCLLYTSDAADE